MNCPQCGSEGHQSGAECRTCGFTSEQAEAKADARVPMDTNKRDVLNGVGMGCSLLCIVWFIAETVVFALTIKYPATWAIYGPIVSVGVPLVTGGLLYIALGNRSAFSKGVGYSLLITVVLAALFAYIGVRYHDTKPSPIASHNGFE